MENVEYHNNLRRPRLALTVTSVAPHFRMVREDYVLPSPRRAERLEQIFSSTSEELLSERGEDILPFLLLGILYGSIGGLISFLLGCSPLIVLATYCLIGIASFSGCLFLHHLFSKRLSLEH